MIRKLLFVFAATLVFVIGVVALLVMRPVTFGEQPGKLVTRLSDGSLRFGPVRARHGRFSEYRIAGVQYRSAQEDVTIEADSVTLILRRGETLNTLRALLGDAPVNRVDETLAALEGVRVSGARYECGRDTLPCGLQVEKLTLIRAPDQWLVHGAGRHNDDELEIGGRLSVGAKDVNIEDLSLLAGDGELAAIVSGRAAADETALAAQLAGDGGELLRRMFGAIPELPSVSASGRLSVAGDETRIEDFSLLSAPAKLDGSLAYEGAARRIAVTAHFGHLDIDALTALFTPAGGAGAEPAEAVGHKEAAGGQQPPWQVQAQLSADEVRFADYRLVDLEGAMASRDDTMVIDRLTARLGNSLVAPAEIRIAGRVDELASSPALDVKLDGLIRGSVSGTLDLDRMASNQLRIDVASGEVEKLVGLGGARLDLPTTGSLAGDVRGGPDDLRASIDALVLGESDIKGTIELTRSKTSTAVKARLSSRRLAMDELLGRGDEDKTQGVTPGADEDDNSATDEAGDIQVKAMARQSGDATAQSLGEESRGGQDENVASSPPPLDLLIPDTAWPLDWMSGIAMDIGLDARRLSYVGQHLDAIALALVQTDREIKLSPIAANFHGASIQGRATLARGTAGDARVEFELRGQGEDQTVDTGDGPEPPGLRRLDLQLGGSGPSPHRLAADLNGHADLQIVGLEIEGNLLETIGSDILMNALSAINPFGEKQENTLLNCVSLRIKAQDGVLSTSEPIVVDGQRMQIRGEGEIDFHDEGIQFSLQPKAKEGVGVNVDSLVKFIEIGGTLAEPKPVVSGAGLVKSGAAVGAAISTGGLSVVAEGLIKKASVARSPCKNEADG